MCFPVAIARACDLTSCAIAWEEEEEEEEEEEGLVCM
jgi:hypothetical protein